MQIETSVFYATVDTFHCHCLRFIAHSKSQTAREQQTRPPNNPSSERRAKKGKKTANFNYCAAPRFCVVSQFSGIYLSAEKTRGHVSKSRICRWPSKNKMAAIIKRPHPDVNTWQRRFVVAYFIIVLPPNRLSDHYLRTISFCAIRKTNAIVAVIIINF